MAVEFIESRIGETDLGEYYVAAWYVDDDELEVHWTPVWLLSPEYPVNGYPEAILITVFRNGIKEFTGTKGDAAKQYPELADEGIFA